MSDIADRVEAAADRLHHLVAGATPGDWAAVPITYPGHEEPSDWEIRATSVEGVSEDVVSHQTYEGGGIDKASDAAYITAVQPRRGAFLADYLHSLAGQLRLLESVGRDLAVSSPLLALVDAINAGPEA